MMKQMPFSMLRMLSLLLRSSLSFFKTSLAAIHRCGLRVPTLRVFACTTLRQLAYWISTYSLLPCKLRRCSIRVCPRHPIFFNHTPFYQTFSTCSFPTWKCPKVSKAGTFGEKTTENRWFWKMEGPPQSHAPTNMQWELPSTLPWLMTWNS